ncbi:hypothetical protein NPIL_23331 [Nephila pilipes]|uniref:Uncharacterized protein n=1 Tax=Nephila pilipes TaxID=299642 RepID=A0A8X6NRW0_NEPPI|nr:hypothetical protein NPIL_23331 [Nephila pilipes]
MENLWGILGHDVYKNGWHYSSKSDLRTTVKLLEQQKSNNFQALSSSMNQRLIQGLYVLAVKLTFLDCFFPALGILPVNISFERQRLKSVSTLNKFRYRFLTLGKVYFKTKLLEVARR